MTMKLTLTIEQLRGIPLLHDLTDQQIERVTELFVRRDVEAGATVFDAGEPAESLYLLEQGEVTLFQANEPTHRLRPLVIIGELGATVGLRRNSKAVAGEGTVIWELKGTKLRDLFLRHGDVGLGLQHTLLALAADKINRDQTRLADMRHNLVRTQKAMKRMRDFLLESQDTVVSKPMHEILEGLIRQNRRANYRVTPPPALTADWRQDDGGKLPVVEISRTHVSLRLDQGELPAAGSRVSAVLCLSGPEIPVSGKVLRTIQRRIDIELDLLLDDYAETLEGYLTRIQMLDFLV